MRLFMLWLLNQEELVGGGERSKGRKRPLQWIEKVVKSASHSFMLQVVIQHHLSWARGPVATLSCA